MLRTFNAKHLVAITVNDKEQHEYYYYVKGTNFFLWKTKGTFRAFGQDYSVEQILEDNKNLIVEDNKIYHKPSVAFRFSNKTVRVVYFDTLAEAKVYGAQMVKEHIALRDQIYLND